MRRHRLRVWCAVQWGEVGACERCRGVEGCFVMRVLGRGRRWRGGRRGGGGGGAGESGEEGEERG